MTPDANVARAVCGHLQAPRPLRWPYLLLICLSPVSFLPNLGLLPASKYESENDHNAHVH